MKYFTIYELTKSSTAERLNINNTPNSAIRANLIALIEKVLDPLREKWGMPIIVTSGYRCDALNRAVGGATNSQHRNGEAADIRTVSDSREDNMKLLKCLLRSGIVFDQVICEYPDAQGRPDWIHVSFKRNGMNRKNKITANRIGSKTYYTNGIVV